MSKTACVGIREICEASTAEAVEVLDELDRAHALFGTWCEIASPALAWARAHKLSRPVRIVDAGCGTGGLLLRMEKLFARSGIACELTGVDINPRAITRARERASGSRVAFRCGTLEDLPDGSADLVTGAFVLHHLEISRLGEWMRQVRRVASCGTIQFDFRRDHSAMMRCAWQAALRVAGFSEALVADGAASLARARAEREIAFTASVAGWKPRITRVAGLCLRLEGYWDRSRDR